MVTYGLIMQWARFFKQITVIVTWLFPRSYNLDCLLSHKVNMFQVNEEKVLQLLFISVFILVATGKKGGKRLRGSTPKLWLM